MKKLFITLISILLCINISAQQTYYAQAAVLIDENEYEQAIELLTQSIEYRETPAWIPYLLRAICYGNTQKITSALNDTEIALQKINTDKNQKSQKIYWIYSVRSEIFKTIGDYNRAIAEISNAIKSSPNNKITQSLLKTRGDYHFFNSNYSASIKDYQQVLKINPKNLTMKLSIVRSIITEQEQNLVDEKKLNNSALKKALALTNEIIAADPKYDAAYKFRVRTHTLMNNYDEAIRDAYSFRNSHSTIVASLNGDGVVEYAEKLFFQCANLDTVVAQKILLEEIAKKPENPLPYYLSAMLYYYADNNKKGIEMFTQAINKTDRELNELLIQRSKCYYDDKDYDNALTDLHIAKQQNDSSAYIFYLQGNCYNKLENWAEAVKNYGEVIRLKPNISDGYIKRSNAYKKMKEFELAAADLDSALKLDDRDVDVLYAYAFLNMEKGDRKASNEVYEKILEIADSIAQNSELNPKYMAGIYNNMAYNYVKLGEYEQAEKYVEKALKLNQESGYIWDTRGELYFYLKKYNECIADMNKAIELRSEDDGDEEPANSYFYRGRAKLELGQTEEGNADIQKAVELKHEEALEFVKTRE